MILLWNKQRIDFIFGTLIITMIDFICVCSGLFRWLYERFRLPIAPVYGGFPVKFRTFLGDPIPYDPNTTAAELAERVSQSKSQFCILSLVPFLSVVFFCLFLLNNNYRKPLVLYIAEVIVYSILLKLYCYCLPHWNCRLRTGRLQSSEAEPVSADSGGSEPARGESPGWVESLWIFVEHWRRWFE